MNQRPWQLGSPWEGAASSLPGSHGNVSLKEQRPLLASSEQDGARDDTLGPGDSPLPWMEEAVPLQCPRLRALEAVGTSESVGPCNGCGSRGKVNSWGPLEEVDVKYACIRQLGAVGQFVIM